jgi:hypothetical protein
MNHVLVQSARTIQANNPVNPRKLKEFRVSFYQPSEVDQYGLAPLHVIVVQAFNAPHASSQVIKGERKQVSVYKSTGLPPLGKTRRIYTLSPTFTRPKNMTDGHWNQDHFRMYPTCRRPGCEKPNAKWQQYCSEACRRAMKNERQLLTKSKRLTAAEKKGKRLCRNCAARPIGSFNPKQCNKCFLSNRGGKFPIQRAERQQLRIQDQLPQILEVMLKSDLHKCTRVGDTKGERLPRCGCRLHTMQWLVINAERFVALRRPFQSYRMAGEPMPPWFKPVRKKRVFDGEKFVPKNLLSSIQPTNSMA